jgi:serine/threonine protein phosphatase 1
MITYDNKIQPGDVVALGDIHATWPLFEQFLDWVKDSQATVVLLGDMCDRGGGDLKVLQQVKRLLDDPEGWGLQALYALMGNHEKMFLDAMEDPFGSSYVLWVQNGGNYDQVGDMEREHKEWVRNLPLYMTIGDTLFIHAGVYPGHDPAKLIAEGRGDALLWIRQPFLTYGPEFEGWNPRLKKVVHGHTPTNFEEPPQDHLPGVKGQRGNIDTGAFVKMKGRLTAYNATQNTFHQFSRQPCKN